MLLTSHLVIYSFLWKSSYISNHKFYFNYKKYKKITYKINISYLRIFVLCFLHFFQSSIYHFIVKENKFLAGNWIVLKLPFHNNTSSRAGLWMSNITIISNTTLENHKKMEKSCTELQVMATFGWLLIATCKCLFANSK